ANEPSQGPAAVAQGAGGLGRHAKRAGSTQQPFGQAQQQDGSRRCQTGGDTPSGDCCACGTSAKLTASAGTRRTPSTQDLSHGQDLCRQSCRKGNSQEEDAQVRRPALATPWQRRPETDV